MTDNGDTTSMPQAEIVPQGHWRPDGTFQSPEGWPDGAGWVVKNADGSIDQWGPASDFQLVAFTDAGQGLPPPEDLSIQLKGVPEPSTGEESPDGGD